MKIIMFKKIILTTMMILCLSKLYACCKIQDIDTYRNVIILNKIEETTYESTRSTIRRNIKIVNDNTTELSSEIHLYNQYKQTFYYLDSSNGYLETIKSYSFLRGGGDFLYFVLNNNKITNLEPNAFIGLPRLGHLDLSNNNISSTNNLFKNLTDLCYLNISHNQIYFIDLTGIKANNIDLSNNYITNITIMDDNYNLNYLKLSNNQIKVIPIGMFHKLKNLNTLILSHNDLKSFKLGSFSGLWNLHHLDLSHNKLIDFQSNKLLTLKNLTILNVAFNEIKSIDSEIFIYLDSLSELIFDGNKLYSNNRMIVRAIICKNFTNCKDKTISLGQNLQTCEQLLADIIYGKEKGMRVSSVEKVYTRPNILDIECQDNINL